MPPKKRTDQTKRTPPTSPTASTSHTSADQHHRLRHAGPSITRASAGASSSKPPLTPTHPEPTPESAPTQKGSREKKLLAEVSPPGARVPFTKFLYVLLVVVLLLLGWYIYGMITLLEKLKEEVGWWGIIVGDSERMTRWGTMKGWGLRSDREGGNGGDLEGSLNALAAALGIAPVQVASAVKPLVPQASLTSIASKAEGTGGSEVVRILFEDTTRNDRDRADTTQIVGE